MTGPEHYRKGEQFLDKAEEAVRNEDLADYTASSTFAEIAQAHFAAALAAGTVMVPMVLSGKDYRAWEELLLIGWVG